MTTCVSERSGIASRDVLRIAATPKPAATSTANTVTTGRRAQSEMSRSIIGASPRPGRAQLALGADQEVPRGHDDVARGEPAPHLVIPVRRAADLDLTRREAAVA